MHKEPMRLRLLTVALFLCPLALAAQSEGPPPYEIFAGYSFLSNSLNGLPGSRQPLNGFDGGVAFPAWHGLRVKIDVTHYSGTNLGAKQDAIFIMGGGQYERTVHRERLFVEALFGDVGMNRYWGPNAHAGMTASFSTQLGGGFDTPLNRHFALRVQGDYRFSNLALIYAVNATEPYRVPGLPQNFGSISTGLVWMPHATSAITQASGPKSPVDSELNFLDINSFGHYHIFANSWWSYLHVAGVEYDRHSWGRWIGARRDYEAEILPISILKQSNITNVFGIPRGNHLESLYGLGISPVGMRLIWRDGKVFKPYYSIKGGLIAFNKKAISQDASYLNFTLQQTLGIQFRLTDRWDLRTGIDDFHFSNAFMVPSNPGIDEMTYSGGLTYHLNKRISPLN
jgi:hypothetical protein